METVRLNSPNSTAKSDGSDQDYLLVKAPSVDRRGEENISTSWNKIVRRLPIYFKKVVITSALHPVDDSIL